MYIFINLELYLTLQPPPPNHDEILHELICELSAKYFLITVKNKLNFEDP